MDDRSETGLALHDGVWDTHLTAESWQEDDELNWVDIVGDEDELGLLGLDQADNVVETVLGVVWLLADVLLLLALSNSGGLLVQTLLLLGLGLWAVLVEELESLGGSVAVEGVRELSNRRWDLETHVQDLALALQADVLGPLHHAREVALGLDVLANAIVAWAALDERVLLGISTRGSDGVQIGTYLGLLLASCTSLASWERRRSGLLGTGLWRLSLRRTVSASCFSTETVRGCDSVAAAQAKSHTHRCSEH